MFEKSIEVQVSVLGRHTNHICSPFPAKGSVWTVVIDIGNRETDNFIKEVRMPYEGQGCLSFGMKLFLLMLNTWINHPMSRSDCNFGVIGCCVGANIANTASSDAGSDLKSATHAQQWCPLHRILLLSILSLSTSLVPSPVASNRSFAYCNQGVGSICYLPELLLRVLLKT